MYEVRYTIRGAYTIRWKIFDTLAEANRFAARWRASNSTGHYVATVYKAGQKLAS